MATEQQLKIWGCHLCDTRPHLEVQRMLVTTCSLSNQNHAQHLGACGSSQVCCITGCSGSRTAQELHAQELHAQAAAAPASLHTGAVKSHPVLSCSSERGCGERAAAPAAERVLRPVPRGLRSLHGSGTATGPAAPQCFQQWQLLPAQGSFSCHIPDV